MATKEEAAGRINPKGARLVSSGERREYRKLIDRPRRNVKIIGCGGSGSNTINRLIEEGIERAEVIAANTDAQHLLLTQASRKILLGRRAARGFGAGAIPQIGEQSAREAEDDIRQKVEGSDIVFVTAGMGGGTGTGAAPVVAEIATDIGSLVISVVTMPFKAEGEMRKENALWGLEKLKKKSDMVVVISDDKLLEIVPHLPWAEAFRFVDDFLTRLIKELTELVTKPGLVDLDYTDFETIMGGGGMAMIGMGESDANGQDKVEQAVAEAISSPLIEGDISEAKGALVMVVGDDQMTVSEAEGAVRMVQQRVNSNARIIWGASIDPSLKGAIRVLVVLTGIKSPYTLGAKGELSIPATIEAVTGGPEKNFEEGRYDHRGAEKMKTDMANQLHISIHAFNKYYKAFSKDLDNYFKERQVSINDFEKILLLKVISEVARGMRDAAESS